MRDWTVWDEFVRERMRKTRLPGVSLSVVKGEEVVYARGYGFRDLRCRLPATPRTVYGIGSITKSFTAVAILQLAEEGKLTVDNPVERFLPLRIRPRGEPIRIEHLLTHTTGLPALAYAEAQIRWEQGTGGAPLPLATAGDFVAWLDGAEDWVEARPGERWFYLNEGYILLGAIIERVSGRTYAQYVRERILEPVGMTETGFLGEDLGPELATPYVIPAQGEPKEGKVVPMPIGSDGGLASTALDLAKYLAVFLRRGAPLLQAEAFAEMVRPRVPQPHGPAVPGPIGRASYACGLSVQPFLGRTLVGHGGSVLVYTAHIGFVPEEGVGVAVLANGSGYPVGQLAQAALAFALGGDPQDLPFVQLEALGEKIFGVYATYRDTMRVTVRAKGGAVELTVEDREAPVTTILVFEELGGGEARFRAVLGDRFLPVIFRTKGREMELVYERYKLRRISPLP